MIKASELREGNIYKAFCYVLQFDSSDQQYYDQASKGFPKFEPVPLSRSILKKLHRLNDISFDISGVKYVHELQNLYFSMTGKELKVGQGDVNFLESQGYYW